MARRERGAETYARRGPTREPYDFVLIVCEGTKTEPAYFTRLKILHRLSSANIKIMPADGNDPMSIITFAENAASKDDYDRIYCVFDRNEHTNYAAALQRIADSSEGKAGRLIAITSWPCFEIWVLLHFKYSSAAFVKTSRESACDKVVGEVRRHLRVYVKGYKTIFDELSPKLPTALQNAKRLQRENAKTGSDNPGTKVHDLVEYLLNLKGVA